MSFLKECMAKHVRSDHPSLFFFCFFLFFVFLKFLPYFDLDLGVLQNAREGADFPTTTKHLFIILVQCIKCTAESRELALHLK